MNDLIESGENTTGSVIFEDGGIVVTQGTLQEVPLGCSRRMPSFLRSFTSDNESRDTARQLHQRRIIEAIGYCQDRVLEKLNDVLLSNKFRLLQDDGVNERVYFAEVISSIRRGEIILIPASVVINFKDIDVAASFLEYGLRNVAGADTEDKLQFSLEIQNPYSGRRLSMNGARVVIVNDTKLMSIDAKGNDTNKYWETLANTIIQTYRLCKAGEAVIDIGGKHTSVRYNIGRPIPKITIVNAFRSFFGNP